MNDERSAIIEREHGLVLAAGRQAVKHAMACGDVLLSVKADTGDTQRWEAWVGEHTSLSRTTAFKYARLARFRTIIEQHDPTSIRDAIELLRDEAGAKARTPVELRDEMLRMRDDGLTLEQIADETGVAVGTAWRWVSPTALPHQQAARAAQRERQERERVEADERSRVRAVRLAAGPKSPASVGYSHLRRATEALDAAMRNAVDGDSRRELATAVAALHEAEDALVRALGIEHGARKVAA